MPIDQAPTKPLDEAVWRAETGRLLAAATGLAPDGAAAWAEGVPAGFAEARSPAAAAADIAMCQQEGPSARLIHVGDASALRLSWAGRPTLSHVIAVLDRLGMEVQNHTSWQLRAPDGIVHLLDDFAIERGDLPAAAEQGRRSVDTLLAVLAGRTVDDGFNRLSLVAGVDWAQAAWVRCWYRYLRQTGLPLGLRYIEEALARHPRAVAALVATFTARFSPSVTDRDAAETAARAAAAAAVEAVPGRDDARILRAGLTLIDATLRTNAFLADEEGRTLPRLAIKVDPSRLDWAPLPRPHREVFVHSPAMEGIHLRATSVSRGGIRWSDRPEDLRTEVLGLMKAQQVKNAGIVPGGAKGGFVLRRPADDAVAASRTAYTEFIRGLLDITDNIVEGRVVRDPRLVVHDGDDPYLVVAADKGTATFSDLANGVAAEYGFWLGDAFASGGSAGFDHKQLGITARGAWESLVRHLGERGLDPQHDPIEVVGIGDMSGDVFGNAMLLSRKLRLIAAFDHRHVFVDPDPEPEAAWEERARLAALPGSSWADYDPARLSAGGGVYPRHVASITLSQPACDALGVLSPTLSPDDLIRAVLRAPVDVLFNGGVGTYVKASSEAHVDARDPSRDDQRVDATDLRASIVVEGGNLGLTQRARVQFALAGGRVNTDFLDNSAGVSTSDREVNIKVLLDADVAVGNMQRAERDQWLHEVVPDVTAAVLKDSGAQARAVSIAEEEAPALLDRHRQLIRVLQRQGRLDPVVEDLPDETELDRRRAAGAGLSRPELALLLAYSKDVVRDELLHSDALEDQELVRAAQDYLPTALRSAVTIPFTQHPLHREITATVVANQLINRVGSSFIDRLEELTANSTVDVVRAYTVVSAALGVDELWSRIEGLDTARYAHAQTTLLIALRRVLEGECLWLLRNVGQPIDVSAETERLRPRARALLGSHASFHPQPSQQQLASAAEQLRNAGAPDDIAEAAAALTAAFPIVAVAQTAHELQIDVPRVARAHLLLGRQLGWTDLLDRAAPHASDDHWRHVASAAIRLTIEEHGMALVRQYLAARPTPDTDTPVSVEAWLGGRRAATERYLATLGGIRSTATASLPALTVAAHELGNVAGRRR
jgi:glutamate dehydrogenase